jgi:SNF2 family DNA or RNA helicase
VALTAVDELLNNRMEITRVLVVAPLKVAQSVWAQEAGQWQHLRHLRFSKVLGSEADRKAALLKKADIYIINRENLAWLVSLSQGRFKFDMLILDESSSFKNHDSRRFKAAKAVLPAVKRVVIMTGTPMPNTLLDLWAQVYLLDRGARLGESFTRYRDQYFEKDPYRQFTYNLRQDSSVDIYQKQVTDKISDICISLSEKDYLKLPPMIDRVVNIALSAPMMKKYTDFERSQVMGLPDDRELAVVNAAALTNKLLQFANGAVYDEDKDFHEVHSEKLDRLTEIIEDSAGHPVLIFYCFQHDMHRIQNRLNEKGYKYTLLKNDQDVQRWNRKEIEIMLAHPASAGHGLNLQAGGNIVAWYGLHWNLEWYQQGKKRLHRQGQLQPVINHLLLVEGTRDYDVLQALQGKGDRQALLMASLKARVEKYRKSLVA